MRLKPLVSFASSKANFDDLDAYINFARRYLAFAAEGLQAVIVSQNETAYRLCPANHSAETVDG